LSVDQFNHGPAELVVVIPITSKAKGIPFHVSVNPPEGGLTQLSFIKCEDMRSISKERLIQRFGAVTDQTMGEVEDRERILLGL
jgi:mRNA interferase MazF